MDQSVPSVFQLGPQIQKRRGAREDFCKREWNARTKGGKRSFQKLQKASAPQARVSLTEWNWLLKKELLPVVFFIFPIPRAFPLFHLPRLTDTTGRKKIPREREFTNDDVPV